MTFEMSLLILVLVVCLVHIGLTIFIVRLVLHAYEEFLRMLEGKK